MRYWASSLAIVAVLAMTGCNRSPAGPEPTSPQTPGDLATADDPNLPWADLSALRFQGFDPSTQSSFDLVLEGIGARYWPNPEFAPGPNWQPETRWLQFTGKHGTSSGADENRIDGAGRIQETLQGIFGLGKITAVVSGTYTTPFGTERITGTLIFDLAQDLIVPIKGGSFFEPCGTGCIDFAAQPLFTPDPNFNQLPSVIVGELIVATVISVTSISAGSHTCALTGLEGKPYCWGANDHGEIGDGTTMDRLLPVAVSGGLNFRDISAGVDHTCGLTPVGQAYCWGSNSTGQLGDGTKVDRHIPIAVAGGLSFASITTGIAHTCALTFSGTAYCWGSNEFGQVGNGRIEAGPDGDRTSPVAVVGGITFSSELDAHSFLTAGVAQDGSAFYWGLHHDLLESTGIPVAAPGGLSFSHIDAGASHVCGISLGGAAFCWGANSSGQLGDGNSPFFAAAPVPVSGGLLFSAIMAADQHTCGLTPAGAAYCWGHNRRGELGDGTSIDRHTPTAVAVGFAFRGIDTGYNHTCGVTRGGNAYCWGRNLEGQLGDGTTTFRNVPVLVRFF